MLHRAIQTLGMENEECRTDKWHSPSCINRVIIFWFLVLRWFNKNYLSMCSISFQQTTLRISLFLFLDTKRKLLSICSFVKTNEVLNYFEIELFILSKDRYFFYENWLEIYNLNLVHIGIGLYFEPFFGRNWLNPLQNMVREFFGHSWWYSVQDFSVKQHSLLEFSFNLNYPIIIDYSSYDFILYIHLLL